MDFNDVRRIDESRLARRAIPRREDPERFVSELPWKRRRGYATCALQLLLPHALAEGLAHIELTTAADNVASRRVIEANGGIVVERFHKPKGYDRVESLRFRIVLAQARA